MKKINKHWKCLQAGVGLSLLLCLPAACITDGESPEEGAVPSRLRITAEGIGTNTRAGTEEEGTPEERSYNALHIYYISPEGTQLAHREVTAGGTFPVEVSVPKELLNRRAFVYVFASPGEGTVMPDPATLAGLRALMTNGMTEGGLLTYPDGTAHCLPMSGHTDVAGDFFSDTPVTVRLRRSVSKLRIRVENNVPASGDGSILSLQPDKMTIGLLNLRAQSPLLPLPDGSFTPGTIGLFNSQTFDASPPGSFVPQTTGEGATEITWLHTAYANEYLFDTGGGTLPADRTVMKINLPYTIQRGDAPVETQDNNVYELPLDFPLKRNFIYQITIKVYGVGKQDLKLGVQVLPWSMDTLLPDESGRGFDLKGEVYVAEDCPIALRRDGFLITGDDALSDLGLEVVGDPSLILTPTGKDYTLTCTAPQTDADRVWESLLEAGSRSVPEFKKRISIHNGQLPVNGLFVITDRNAGSDLSRHNMGFYDAYDKKRVDNTGETAACPAGFRIPSVEDWDRIFKGAHLPSSAAETLSFNGLSYSLADPGAAGIPSTLYLTTVAGKRFGFPVGGYLSAAGTADNASSTATTGVNEYIYLATADHRFVRIGKGVSKPYEVMTATTPGQYFVHVRCIRDIPVVK